jgi:hypothetical protein
MNTPTLTDKGKSADDKEKIEGKEGEKNNKNIIKGYPSKSKH